MSRAAPAAPSIDAELKTLLRRLKLGRMLDTLPNGTAARSTISWGHRRPPRHRRQIIDLEATGRATTD